MSEKRKIQKTEGKTKAAGKSPRKKKIAPKLAIGVAAAGGATLLAVAMIGFAPTLLAGAAGYFAYSAMNGEKT